VAVDAIEPVPFVIAHVFARRHCRFPFKQRVILGASSHTDGCFVERKEA
jgi:hypothetical protein